MFIILNRVLLYIYLNEIVLRINNKLYRSSIESNYIKVLSKFDHIIKKLQLLNNSDAKRFFSAEEKWVSELKHSESLIIEEYFQSIGRFLISSFFRKISINKKRSFFFFEPKKVQIQKRDGFIYSSFQFSPNNRIMTSAILDSRNTEYFKYIFDKKIAVVGPAHNTLLQGEEIDSFDIVVRVNETKVSEDQHPLIGKKTQVMYLGSYSFNNLSLIKSSYEELRWIVSKEYKSNQTELNYRQLIFNPSFIAGYPQMLSYLIYDLLLFKPSKIKLFNFDLYINKNKYLEKNYPNNTSLASFSEHNMSSQFLYIKGLHEHGMISTDKNLREILELDLEQYLLSFEENF